MGGAIGECAPDILEPSYGPTHRGPAHSLSALALIGKVAYYQLGKRQAAVRRWAHQCAAKRVACGPGSILAFAWAIAEAALRLMAGLLAGVVAGYVSHVALDALTPSGMAVI